MGSGLLIRVWFQRSEDEVCNSESKPRVRNVSSSVLTSAAFHLMLMLLHDSRVLCERSKAPPDFFMGSLLMPGMHPDVRDAFSLVEQATNLKTVVIIMGLSTWPAAAVLKSLVDADCSKISGEFSLGSRGQRDSVQIGGQFTAQSASCCVRR